MDSAQIDVMHIVHHKVGQKEKEAYVKASRPNTWQPSVHGTGPLAKDGLMDVNGQVNALVGCKRCNKPLFDAAKIGITRGRLGLLWLLPQPFLGARENLLPIFFLHMYFRVGKFGTHPLV